MTLLEQIQKTTQSWMVEKNPRTNILKTVIGELQRLPSKNPTDAEVISVLTKMINGVKEYPTETSQMELEVYEMFVPKSLTESEWRLHFLHLARCSAGRLCLASRQYTYR